MSTKSKKQRPPPALSLPQVQDTSAITSLAHFSPDANLFALLSLAVDRHRLRVFDTTIGSVLAEHAVDSAHVTSLAWLFIDLVLNEMRKDESPTKRRKKMTSSVTPSTKTPLVCLGLSNGSIDIFSPTHARVLRTISHPSSLAAVLATATGTKPSHIWSSGADGTVRFWNAARNELLGSWKNEGMTPYSAIAPRPDQDVDSETQLLVANHSMSILSLPTSNQSVVEPIKPSEIFSFTGHASAVRQLQWDHSHPSRFISTAEADRVINVWRVPDLPSKQGSLIASVPIDASVRYAALSPTDTPALLTLSASGKVALFELPPFQKVHPKVVALSPRSIVSSPSKKGHEDVYVIAATFIPHEQGCVRVARLKKGVKPVFDVIRYLDDSGQFISQVFLSNATLDMVMGDEGDSNTFRKRYVEGPSLAVGSGFELDRDLDHVSNNHADGDLEVDLAELSLGQRLTALSGGAGFTVADVEILSSASEHEDASLPQNPTSHRRQKSRRGKDSAVDQLPVPAHSLSRTLVQALHSSDTRLLETCLIHSDETLVLNTVRRLPPQLAIPLLTACVERLERGARANTGKGGGGGASAQRGTGLVRWVKAVLVVHMAHLITIPDLVTRLSSLHAILTARLALRDPLLALSGRLELVLSQIEMRTTTGPTRIEPTRKRGGQEGEKRIPVKYVEGESESEGQEEDVEEIEVERDGDTGSVEDVELGGDSASDEEEQSRNEDEEPDSEDEGSEVGPRLNGFIDDEADEWSEEDAEDFEE